MQIQSGRTVRKKLKRNLRCRSKRIKHKDTSKRAVFMSITSVCTIIVTNTIQSRLFLLVSSIFALYFEAFGCKFHSVFIQKTSSAHRADIQRLDSMLTWIVILSVYGTDTIAEVKLVIFPFLSWVFKQFRFTRNKFLHY
jgi:hypothetical protein